MMKTIIAVSVFASIVSGTTVFFLTREPVKLVAECPAPVIQQEVVENKIVELGEWECNAPELKGSGDLLQPSGYYRMDTVTCWYLQTPIWQWCAEHPTAKCTEEQKKRP